MEMGEKIIDAAIEEFKQKGLKFTMKRGCQSVKRLLK